MTAQPSQFPDFNTNDTDSTAPNASQAADGYALGDRPSRQGENWLRNRVGRWIRFLFERIFTPGDVFADQALPRGDTPSIGAGLVAAAGDFSGRVYVNSLGVGPIQSPAHTYAASSDTYWDLNQDGTWVPTAVANGAAAPAFAANAERVFMVVTDATDRTAFTNFERSLTNPIDVDQPLEFVQQVTHGTSGARTRMIASAGRTLIHETFDLQAGDVVKRVYSATSDVLGSPSIEIAYNAQWVAFTSSWVPDDNTLPSFLKVIDSAGEATLYHATGSAGWSDAVGGSNWQTIGAVGPTQTFSLGGLLIGTAAPAAPATGTVYSDMIVKARGTLQTGPAGPTLTNNRNIQSVAYVAGNGGVQVNFGANIAAGYQVLIGDISVLTPTVRIVAPISDRSATGLIFRQHNAAGGQELVNGTGVHFDFTIVGQ